MESGIYRDVCSDEVSVVFGGAILPTIIRSKQKRDVCIVGFGKLSGAYNVGDKVQGVDRHIDNYPVRLVFNNPKSIEVLQQHLDFAKAYLEGATEDELHKRFPDFFTEINEPTGKKEE